MEIYNYEYNRSGNIGPVKDSVEYAWIENHYQNTDGSGIGRASQLINQLLDIVGYLIRTVMV